MLDSWVIKSKVDPNTIPERKSDLKRKVSSDDEDHANSATKKRGLDNEPILPVAKKRRPSDILPPDLVALYPLESQQMHPSWFRRLADEFSKPYFKELQAFLARERNAGKVIFPPENQIYSWAKYPFEEVKVVILGQDPYHTPGKAHGLAFSVRAGERPPPSLMNMYQELKQDMGVEIDPTQGCLEKWAEQGVLLLNTLLTVVKSSPLSHHNKGWETFTDHVLVTLVKEHPKLVWMLWGAHAQKKIHHLRTKSHCILTSSHPSPFSVTRGFYGSKPYSKANAYLKKNGEKEIDWGKIFEP